MCRMHYNLYTKSQLQVLFQAWQCSEPIPGKGKKVVIAFAGRTDFDVDLIEVELTGLKGTYGDRLYRVGMSSLAGRAIDMTIQESHVVALKLHLAELRRLCNIEKYKNFERGEPNGVFSD